MEYIPTLEEVEALKEDWLANPTWNIWEAKGFEAHQSFLKDWQTAQEADKEKARLKEQHENDNFDRRNK